MSPKTSETLIGIHEQLVNINSTLSLIAQKLGEQNRLLQMQQAGPYANGDNIPYDFTKAPKVAPWSRDDTGTYTPPDNIRITNGTS
jgi:hypothetical protein